MGSFNWTGVETNLNICNKRTAPVKHSLLCASNTGSAKPTGIEKEGRTLWSWLGYLDRRGGGKAIESVWGSAYMKGEHGIRHERGVIVKIKPFGKYKLFTMK